MSTAIRSTSTQATVRAGMWIVVVLVALLGSLSACGDAGTRQDPPAQNSVSLADDEEDGGDCQGDDNGRTRYADGENEADEDEADENENEADENDNEADEEEAGENEDEAGENENEAEENESEERGSDD